MKYKSYLLTALVHKLANEQKDKIQDGISVSSLR